jgi:hypothetical protein
MAVILVLFCEIKYVKFFHNELLYYIVSKII